MIDDTYDIIVVGGGSNGLTCGAYLAKAGQKVLVLERREFVGGGCVTEELTLPGFKHNPHSCMHVWIHLGPVYNDLELEKYGSKYVFPEIQYAAVFPDGRSLVLYRDLDRTLKEIARFSEHDARAYRDFCEGYRGMVDGSRTFLYSPPSEPWMAWSAMMRTPDGAELVKTSLASTRNVVYDTFESPEVRGWILMFMNQTGTDDYPGSGTFLPPLLPIIHYTQAVGCAVGGSSVTAEAIAKVIEANNGTVLRNAHVSKIILDGERATGVELQDGTIFQARKAVTTNVEPKQTFLKMIGEEKFDPLFVRQVQRFREDEFTLFTPHFALNEAPQWKAAEFNPDVLKSWTVGILPDPPDDAYLHLWGDIRAGKASKTYLPMAIIPSLVDPSQAPAGKHSMLLWQPAVYELAGGAERWDEIKDDYGWELYDYMAKFAPNMTRENALKMTVDSPLDIEKRNISMWKASLMGGERAQDQLTVFRPFYGYPPYRTPVESLYMCGPSTHPEGGLSGACGFNAATVMAEDLGIKKWWEKY
ncbi:MAG: NAD(P)/FAD-dependent oxidoreductase [Anaerolineae bacterium]|nr:NAD(P)/FAD-dependent oxidoreductase [Anaerolineae bacterium]